MIFLQQNRNTTPNIKRQTAQLHAKPIDTPKLTNKPFTALQRDEIKFHTTEYRHRLPQQGNLGKPLVQASHREQTPQLRVVTNFHPAERVPQTQQPKQNEKEEKYSSDEGT